MSQGFSNNMITIPIIKESNIQDFEYRERTRKVPKDSIIAEASRVSKTKILNRDSEECKNFAFSNSSHS